MKNTKVVDSPRPVSRFRGTLLLLLTLLAEVSRMTVASNRMYLGHVVGLPREPGLSSMVTFYLGRVTFWSVSVRLRLRRATETTSFDYFPSFYIDIFSWHFAANRRREFFGEKVNETTPFVG